MDSIRIEICPQNSFYGYNKTNKYHRKKEVDTFKLEKLNEVVIGQEKKKPTMRLRQSRWKFKACPRCHGDLNSCYGEDFTCFQCGYICYSWINKAENYKGGYHGKTEES